MLNNHDAIKLLSIVFNQKVITTAAAYDDDTMLEFINEFVDSFKINATNANVSEGEIAKSALQLLSMDNEVLTVIHDTIDKEKPSLPNFGYKADFGTFAGGIGVISMALVILRTYVNFTKDTDGKTIFEIKIIPLGDKQIEEFLKIAKDLMSNIITTKDALK
jgi:hypothetical protein